MFDSFTRSFDLLKASAAMIKKTWGENVAGQVGPVLRSA